MLEYNFADEAWSDTVDRLLLEGSLSHEGKICIYGNAIKIVNAEHALVMNPARSVNIWDSIFQLLSVVKGFASGASDFSKQFTREYKRFYKECTSCECRKSGIFFDCCDLKNNEGLFFCVLDSGRVNLVFHIAQVDVWEDLPSLLFVHSALQYMISEAIGAEVGELCVSANTWYCSKGIREELATCRLSYVNLFPVYGFNTKDQALANLLLSGKQLHKKSSFCKAIDANNPKPALLGGSFIEDCYRLALIKNRSVGKSFIDDCKSLALVKMVKARNDI